MKSSRYSVGVVALQHKLCPLEFLRGTYLNLYEPKTAQVEIHAGKSWNIDFINKSHRYIFGCFSLAMGTLASEDSFYMHLAC